MSSYINPKEALSRLRAGEVVALPTETVYGLAGRIDLEPTLRQIFAVKSRPFFDPLIVHVPDVSSARALTREWPLIYDDLARAFWPGPLTLVAPKATHVSPLITSGLETVAIRCPRHATTLSILSALGIGLAAPSANRFGRTSPTCAEHVISEFAGHVPVVDGGPCGVGVESTVLSCSPRQEGGWRVQILRPGGVSRAEIEAALRGRYALEFARIESNASPGHTKAHYQPENPVVLVRPGEEGAAGAGEIFVLKLNDSPAQAARELYSELRRLSQQPGTIAVPVRPEFETLEWEAVWDRLVRASSRDQR